MSENVASPEAKPPRVRKFGCLKIFLCGLGLVLLAVAYWYTKLHFARRDFLRHTEELVSEIEAQRPQVPDEENAAPLYVEAFNLCVDPDKSGVNSDDDGCIWAGSDYMGYSRGSRHATKISTAGIACYLRANRSCMEAIRKAMARPKCDFGISLRNAELAFPRYWWKAVSISRILAVDVLSEVRAGRINEAVDAHERQLRFARDIGSSGTPGPRAWQARCEAEGVDSLEWILDISPSEEPQVLKLLAILNHHLAKRGDMEDCLRTGKAAFLCSFYGPLVSGKGSFRWPCRRSRLEFLLDGDYSDEPNTTGSLIIGAWQHSGFVLRDARNYETAMQQRIQAAAEPSPRLLDAADYWDRGDDTEWWDLTSTRTMGYVDRLIEQDALALAGLRSAQLALGCRLQKLKFGAYPEKLSELSEKFPEHFKTLPVDPFTGKDLLYKRTDTGCKIWSVGPNRRDDGGLPNSARTRQNPQDYDEVFELKR